MYGTCLYRLTYMIEFDLEFIWYKKVWAIQYFWLPVYNWVFMANKLILSSLFFWLVPFPSIQIMMYPDPGGPKTYGSGSTILRRICLQGSGYYIPPWETIQVLREDDRGKAKNLLPILL
jgi:hypothetical protein